MRGAQPASPWSLLQPLLRPRRRSLALLSFTALSFGLAEAGVLVLIARIAFAMSEGLNRVGAAVGPIRISLTIWQSLAVAAGLIVLRCGLQVLNGWQSARLVTETQATVRRELASAFLHASWERQAKEPAGRLQELLTGFVAAAARLMDTVAKGITSIFSLAALLVTAVVVSAVAAFGLLGALVVLVATLQPLRRLMQPAARTLASTGLGFAQGVSELTTIGREIQVFGVEDEVDGHVDRLIDDSARAARRHAFLGSLFTPLYATVMLLLLVLALAVIWNTGLTNLEELGAVVLLMLRSFAYGQMAQAVWSTLYASAPFLSDLQEQLDSYAADRVDPAGVPAPEGGELDVRGVSYSYGPRVPALDGVSFRIEPGEIVGVIGPSGSGKSTLVQLLLRLRPPAAGSITMDGRPIGDIALADWRRTTSFVPQEPRLIAGTVESNIRFFRDGISHEMIEQAARSAHIHDEIVALPDGYQTVLGGPNAHLSGGQQQRLCITRALVTRPAILVLDEPTSALDAVSEARIRASLDELRGDVTTVIVAHRLSTLDICDRILVLQEGRLVAFDTPQALRRADTFYRRALELSGVR